MLFRSNAATSETNAKQSEDNAGGYAAVATTAATEAVDAMEEAARSAAAFSIYTGTGFPEGKVSAPVGSVYTDSAATNGAIRWIKTSGTGTTGWKVEYGDTGWRNVTSALTASVKSGKVLIRRTNNLVHVSLNALMLNESGTKTIYRFDSPFRPDYKKMDAWYVDSSSAVTDGTFLITDAGYFPVYLIAPNIAMSVHASFACNASWPATLPGTPA